MDKVVFKIQVVVEPVEKGFHAYCPALKGLHTDGDTIEEAFNNAHDAAQAYIRSLIKHGEPIPVGVIASTTDKNNARFSKKNGDQIRDLLVVSA